MNKYHFTALSQGDEGKDFQSQLNRLPTNAALESLLKHRLLSIEQRPFAKISKRLLSPDSILFSKPPSLPTPPPDANAAADEEAAARVAAMDRVVEERRKWREEMLLDFALLEHNLARIQFMRNSNEKERERYAIEKVRIQETAQRVRENTEQLKLQLEEAQKTLGLRKEYDKLTEKITSNRMLRPREDQHAQLEKLNAEIKDLEDQSEEYAMTWKERQNQFSRIVDEGREMLRMIRDEKEEAERKEGMEVDQDTEREGTTTKGETSVVGTPRPDGEGATPLPTTHDAGHDGHRSATQQSAEYLMPTATPASWGSHAPSPGKTDAASQNGEGKDVEMGEAAPSPANRPESEIEEGEEQEDERMED
jgi:Tho complex subunit 7